MKKIINCRHFTSFLLIEIARRKSIYAPEVDSWTGIDLLAIFLLKTRQKLAHIHNSQHNQIFFYPFQTHTGI